MSALIVVMGVSGCGKTSVGKALAGRLGADFLDGDDLHPSANIKKMSAGEPLTDADRVPWLQAIGEKFAEARSSGNGLVVACSALKRAYREQIAQYAQLTFIHPQASRLVLLERLSKRTGHFMPVSLLDSQLDALESLQSDERGVELDARLTIEQQVIQVMDWLEATA